MAAKEFRRVSGAYYLPFDHQRTVRPNTSTLGDICIESKSYDKDHIRPMKYSYILHALSQLFAKKQILAADISFPICH